VIFPQSHPPPVSRLRQRCILNAGMPELSRPTRRGAGDFLILGILAIKIAGWWFGTFFIFPNSRDDDHIRLICFRGIETTK